MKKQQGFSLLELVFVLVWLTSLAISGTLVYWVIKALIAFVSSVS